MVLLPSACNVCCDAIRSHELSFCQPETHTSLVNESNVADGSQDANLKQNDENEDELVGEYTEGHLAQQDVSL
jgi:hypothetical protein